MEKQNADVIVCRDCHADFDFGPEAAFFATFGWPPATRCIPCRRLKKARRQSTDPDNRDPRQVFE
jgi:hypothetical protein